MSRLSFRQRLTLFTAAGIALVLVVGSAATYVVVRSQLRGQIDESLRRQSVAVVIRRDEAGLGFSLSRSALERRRRSSADATPQLNRQQTKIVPPEDEFGTAPSFFQLIDVRREGNGFGGAQSILPVSDRAVEVARTGSGAYYTDVEVRGTPLRMYVRPAGSGRAILAARSLSEVDNALSRLGWSLAITCLAGIALAALVGAIVARGALRPVSALTTTAERITDTHDLGERIDAEGDDELSRLGSTFNAMLDPLATAARLRRIPRAAHTADQPAHEHRPSSPRGHP
jgi:two-component system sensor histidine kinase MprB